MVSTEQKTKNEDLRYISKRISKMDFEDEKF